VDVFVNLPREILTKHATVSEITETVEQPVEAVAG
jgi:hypothetical protein